ncbi:hypothetical protein CIL05_04190 [Virgibacillus profundi]|uniref:YCII-related domain-containing protein n=1 Tax=Virgibacillus profundi TaxID=2024555 RepID=A0A2A2IG04_9BACI|nr:YciI family protein [Virgibacillus profundi]PAV30921.1 hypothetical protein CIL05_04190 [Virgibacillus profundi]PXY55106.1 hypothetical protein CIT14_04270 [Virgibacillus profundi]
MKYFAVFLPMLDEEKSKQYRPDHLAYLEEKGSEGKIFAKGPFVDGAGGLVIYKGENLKEVEEIVKQDPYIVYGARGSEIHEWDMAVIEER